MGDSYAEGINWGRGVFREQEVERYQYSTTKNAAQTPKYAGGSFNLYHFDGKRVRFCFDAGRGGGLLG